MVTPNNQVCIVRKYVFIMQVVGFLKAMSSNNILDMF